MILQIISNRLVCNLAFDTRRPKHFRVTNTRQLENLGCLDGAAGHDHLTLHADAVGLSSASKVDTDSFVLLESD